MQWFKGYWDHITGGQEVADYDAVGRRQASKSGDWKKARAGGGWGWRAALGPAVAWGAAGRAWAAGAPDREPGRSRWRVAARGAALARLLAGA